MKARVKNFANTAFVGALLVLIAITGPVLAEPNMWLYGALVAEPCVIPPGEEVVELDFGPIIDESLYLNTRTPGQPFSIHLTECELSWSNMVSVTFLGTESLALPGLLAIDGGSQATGIAIGLETEQAKPVPVNTASDPYQLQGGDNRIALKAYVQGEPDAITHRSIERGPFNATATFSLTYE